MTRASDILRKLFPAECAELERQRAEDEHLEALFEAIWQGRPFSYWRAWIP